MSQQKRKVTQLALYRRCLMMQRHSLEQAVKCAKSRDKFERTDMVQAYKADAAEYKELADMVKAGTWVKAFKYWERLDTFVREAIYGEYATYLYARAIRENANAKEKANRRTNRK